MELKLKSEKWAISIATGREKQTKPPPVHEGVRVLRDSVSYDVRPILSYISKLVHPKQKVLCVYSIIIIIMSLYKMW